MVMDLDESALESLLMPNPAADVFLPAAPHVRPPAYQPPNSLSIQSPGIIPTSAFPPAGVKPADIQPARPLLVGDAAVKDEIDDDDDDDDEPVANGRPNHVRRITGRNNSSSNASSADTGPSPSPAQLTMPTRGKQKRNKPTLSCFQCVERKTKARPCCFPLVVLIRVAALRPKPVLAAAVVESGRQGPLDALKPFPRCLLQSLEAAGKSRTGVRQSPT